MQNFLNPSLQVYLTKKEKKNKEIECSKQTLYLFCPVLYKAYSVGSLALQIVMGVWLALGSPQLHFSLECFAGKHIWVALWDFLSEYQGSHSDQHKVWT